MSTKSKAALLLGSVLIGLGLSGCVLFFEPHSGREHVFSIASAPTFLTEELAVEKAREYLAKEGYDLEQWRITTTDRGRSKAPDGTLDRYLYRFNDHPTDGSVVFSNGKKMRTVSVWLDGSRIVCCMYYGL